MTDERRPPKLEGEAPGLVWRARKKGWAATWQARSDLVARGYVPKSLTLWKGAEPDPIDREHITSQCQYQQAEMLMSRQSLFRSYAGAWHIAPAIWPSKNT